MSYCMSCMSLACLLHVLHVSCMSLACLAGLLHVLHVSCMSLACLLHVSCMSLACLLHVSCMSYPYILGGNSVGDPGGVGRHARADRVGPQQLLRDGPLLRRLHQPRVPLLLLWLQPLQRPSLLLPP